MSVRTSPALDRETQIPQQRIVTAVTITLAKRQSMDTQVPSPFLTECRDTAPHNSVEVAPKQIRVEDALPASANLRNAALDEAFCAASGLGGRCVDEYGSSRHLVFASYEAAQRLWAHPRTGSVGQKRSEHTQRDGKLEGVVTIWWENGQKMVEATYLNGTRTSGTEWDENGNQINAD